MLAVSKTNESERGPKLSLKAEVTVVDCASIVCLSLTNQTNTVKQIDMYQEFKKQNKLCLIYLSSTHSSTKNDQKACPKLSFKDGKYCLHRPQERGQYIRHRHTNSTAVCQMEVCFCSLLSLRCEECSLRLITAEENQAKGNRGQSNIYTSLCV